MAPTLVRREFTQHGHTTSFLSAGPTLGPLLIFVHGWPGIAATWTRQLEAFAALGFWVVAPDMRGYGRSSVPKNAADYRLEVIVQDMLDLLAHLQRPEAIWIGHDWGSCVVWSLASHHPEVFRATANLAVPRGIIEAGLDAMLATVNRDIYPEKDYPYGQWDYQVFYERDAARATAQFEANSATSVKAVYGKVVWANYGKPAPQSVVIRDGGRFGGANGAPDVPLEQTVFAGDEPLYKEVAEAMERTGWFGATAYYLNHPANAAYTQSRVKREVLDFPVLFVQAKHDPVCSTSLSRQSEPMRRTCSNLAESSVDAAHWLQLEKPDEVNSILAKWLATQVEDWWPGYWSTPLVVRPKQPKE